MYSINFYSELFHFSILLKERLHLPQNVAVDWFLPIDELGQLDNLFNAFGAL